MHAPREDTVPWYRQFWPWFILSIPAGTIVAAMYTINLAYTTSDGLVSDNYYKEGLAMHKDAAQSDAAAALGIKGDLKLDTETGAIQIALSSNKPLGNGSLTLDVIHPTQKDMDQAAMLTYVGPGNYVGKINLLSEADWKLRLMPEDKAWRVEGRIKAPGRTKATLD